MHGAHASGLQFLYEPEVEIRCIDADERRRLRLERAPVDVAPQRQQTRQMAQDFDHAHDAELFGPIPDIHAGRSHQRPADASEA